MISTKFEAYKVRRELKKAGIKLLFKRLKKNDFKEPTDEIEASMSLTGLYHEQNNYISVKTGDTTQTRPKKTPMVLCLYEEAKSLKVEDVVEINSKKFKVTGIANIQEWNIIADISLEVIDNGI